MQMGNESATALLRAFPSLGAALGSGLHRLAADAIRESISEGAVILVERGTTDSLFLVCSGEVQIEIDAGGHPLRLGTLGPSRWFGELGFLGVEGATATVTAVQPSLLLRIPRAAFLTYLEEEPAIASALLGEILPGMCHRLRETRSLVDRGSAALEDTQVRDDSFVARVWRSLFGGV